MITQSSISSELLLQPSIKCEVNNTFRCKLCAGPKRGFIEFRAHGHYSHFLSASAVSGGTCTSPPHPSLKKMSDRARAGMAKACFTVTKSPVSNLNRSQWMSPALSRDTAMAPSPNKPHPGFGWADTLKTRGNHCFYSRPLVSPLQITIYLKISCAAWVMTNDNTPFIYHETTRGADVSGAIVWR